MLFRDNDMKELWNQMKAEPLTEGQLAVIGFVERWADLIESEMAQVEGSTALAVFPDRFVAHAREADTQGLTENEFAAAFALASAVLTYGPVIRDTMNPRTIYGGR